MSYRIELKDGTVLYPEGLEDPYQRAFHGVLARRDTCEECKYYKFPRQGDFTIGDFWGIEHHDNSWVDGKGVSVVLANNEKAADVMGQLCCRFERIEMVPLDWCMNKGNRIGTEARPSHPNKKYFEWLVKRKTFRDAVIMADEGKYDIGLVCLHNCNAGNNLTNLALHRILTDMGYSVLLLAWKQDYAEKGNPFQRFLKKPYEEWQVHFLDEKAECYSLNDICDFFVVGSDQLFRDRFLKDADQFYSLDWVRSDKYKMTYATSFGTDVFEGSEYDENRFAYFLKRMQRISVRESGGAEITGRMTGHPAEVVLDPVFLCDRSVYNHLADIGKERLPKEKYVGGYLLDITPQKEKILLACADELTQGVYRVATDYPDPPADSHRIETLSETKIEEWLALIRGCEFFVTDSFHGICFAIIFEKQFAVVFDKENWRGYDRIREILSKFHLMDRMISGDSTEEIERIKKKIDYARVKTIIDAERSRSMQFIRGGVEEAKHYKAAYSTFDYFLEKQYETNAMLKRLEEEKERMKSKICKLNAEMFIRDINREEEFMDEVICFGTGKCFRENIDDLKMVCNVQYACDNDAEKWGSRISENVEIISPHKLKEMVNPVVVITVYDIKVAFDIARQLISMGIYHFTHVSNLLAKSGL